MDTYLHPILDPEVGSILEYKYSATQYTPVYYHYVKWCDGGLVLQDDTRKPIALYNCKCGRALIIFIAFINKQICYHFSHFTTLMNFLFVMFVCWIIWSICDDNILSFRIKNSNETLRSQLLNLSNHKTRMKFSFRGTHAKRLWFKFSSSILVDDKIGE